MANETRKVPRLSLKAFTDGDEAEKKKFSVSLVEGLRDFGFVVLFDHPISRKILTDSYDLSEKLFALDLETKMKYSADKNGGQRGYTAFGIEHAKDAAAIDLKEFWHVGQSLPSGHRFENTYAKNIWPEELSDFESTFSKLYQSLENTGRIMLRALCHDLEVGLEFFDEMTEYGNSILRLLHYPPISKDTDPKAIRAAAHEDINLITLLVSASVSGLQLLDRDGKWLDVESEEGDIIVDSGDMLARLTNEVYPATTHRVVNPDDPSMATKSRYSMPFFMHPHPEAMLNCLNSCKGDGAKYADITAHDFLMQRLKEIGLIK